MALAARPPARLPRPEHGHHVVLEGPANDGRPHRPLDQLAVRQAQQSRVVAVHRHVTYLLLGPRAAADGRNAALIQVTPDCLEGLVCSNASHDLADDSGAFGDDFPAFPPARRLAIQRSVTIWSDGVGFAPSRRAGHAAPHAPRQLLGFICGIHSVISEDFPVPRFAEVISRAVGDDVNPHVPLAAFVEERRPLRQLPVAAARFPQDDDVGGAGPERREQLVPAGPPPPREPRRAPVVVLVDDPGELPAVLVAGPPAASYLVRYARGVILLL